jgi:hypothetical protein
VIGWSRDAVPETPADGDRPFRRSRGYAGPRSGRHLARADSVRPSRAAGGCQFAAEVDAPGDDLRAPWSGCLSAAVTGLCERVAEDSTCKGYLGRTIGVKLRFDDIRIVTRDLTVPAPTADATAIRRAATVP